MSDDGTNAAKKIAYCVHLQLSLAQAANVIAQMRGYSWSDRQESEVDLIAKALDDSLTRTQELINDFYKVIGEGG